MRIIVAVCLLLTSYFHLSVVLAGSPTSAAVASAHPMATRAGMEILQAGGNAFDAAVAVSATLAVVEPYSSGMGGGGFWLLQAGDGSDAVMIDGRETAPGKASRNMYQDKNGKVIANLSVNGALAAGIPGQPAALVHIAKNYGRLPLRTTLAPAIRAARQGFKVTPQYRRMAGFRLEALQASPAAAKVFLHNNQVPPLGHRVRQPDLAMTLERLAKAGIAGFYDGNVAQKLVSGVQSAGGIWRREDLAQYRVVQRKPIVGEYHGYRIISAAPPSSGGVALLGMLKMLRADKLETMPKAQRQHLIIEAMRRVYRDRAEFLGDTDFIKVPVARLLSDAYADKMRRSIDINKATPSSTLKSIVVKNSGHHTSHFSILDKHGNRVAATLSVNYPFGSGFMPPGTGVLLNDEMDDFSAKPGSPNVYGLVGGEANSIAPGKRMLSSMSPTIVEGPERIAILGTPGGSRIITMVLHGILAVVAGDDVKQLVSQPRFHHQYLPDVVQYEPGAFSKEVQQALKQKGHQLKRIENGFGNMQAVIWNTKNNKVTAASDPRGEGLAQVR